MVILFVPLFNDAHLYSLVSYDFGRTWLHAYSQVDDYHDGEIEFKAVTAGPERILAAWAERGCIWSSYSDDGGLSWSSPDVRVDDCDDWTTRGHLTVYGCMDGSFIAAWSQARYDGDTDVWCAVSEDGGESWSENVQVNGDFNGAQQIPDIAQGPDGLIYLGFVNVRSLSVSEVHVAVSNDNGYHWSGSSQPINDEVCLTSSPEVIVCEDGMVVATWADYRHTSYCSGYISWSTDGGTSWSNNKSITSHRDIGKPFIATLPDNEIVITYGLLWSDFEDYHYSVRGRRDPVTPPPTYSPRPTWTDRPTWTPSPTPTITPTAPAETPSPTTSPTAVPTPAVSPTPTACSETGVTLSMPAHVFRSGDLCNCHAVVCNAEGSILWNHPLFVILEVQDMYYFAPGFMDTPDSFLGQYPEFPPGLTDIEVIGEFTWPESIDPVSGIRWYGALTNPEITEVKGTMDTFEFGWE